MNRVAQLIHSLSSGKLWSVDEILVMIEAVGYQTVSDDILSGTIDGSNATFTTTHNFIPETVSVFINGLKQKVIQDYNTSGNNTIIFIISPEVGDVLQASYVKV